MESKIEEMLIVISPDEFKLRVLKVTDQMSEAGLDAVLISDLANLYYLTGRVFCGNILLQANGDHTFFLRRPSTLKGDNIICYRKVEEVCETVAATLKKGSVLGLPFDELSYSEVLRYQAALPDLRTENASPVMRRARAVKTAVEIHKMEMSGLKQAQVYREIPHLYHEGMTDIEFQIEIERSLRLGGCLGLFRTSGNQMEIFMGNVLTGQNADTPSPYDFAMGGEGMDTSIPVGANGGMILPGHPVMVDMNGNFTGYMTDMTRCYIDGEVPELARKANDLSKAICEAVADRMRPGVEAKALYNLAHDMVKEAEMENYFMGHRHHAGFIGHGVGITINELPVLAPRSRDIIQAFNTVALEPKFVLPGLGAVGVENTYVVQPDGPARCITVLNEDIESLT